MSINPRLLEDAKSICKKRIFQLFDVEEVASVLHQLEKLRIQNPGYRDDELLMFELLAVTKLKGAN